MDPYPEPDAPPRLIKPLLWWLATVVVAAVAILIVMPGSAGAQQTRSARPTIVLVHGAWADSSSWSGVIARLRADGFPVMTVATPLRSLPGDAAYVSSILQTIHGPIVLVGHSYGGAVITDAATGSTQVKALVYVDGFAPDAGETVVGLATQRPGSAIGGDPATTFDAVPYPGAPQGDVDLYVKPGLFRSAFANDLPPREAAVLASVQRPVAASALQTPSATPAWRSIPSWYLVGTIDRVIPPAEQLFMARRAGAHIVRVRASHLPMVSRPSAVTAVIRAAATR